MFPTLVTDRFGNTVRYTYDRTDKWKLLEIRGSDGTGNPDRVLTLQYVPNTHYVSSVSDGLRTWSYAYGSDVMGNNLLTTVTLPDQSSWKFDGMGARGIFDPGLVFLHIDYAPPSPNTPVDMECDAMPGDMSSYPAMGTMVHPSGAIATFKLFPTRHARNGIPPLCYGDDELKAPRAYYPQYFDMYALTEKSIEGPGLQKMTWATQYDTFNPGWDDCEACKSASSIVSVTDPQGKVTRYSFGSTFKVNEGMLQRVDVDWNGSSALRTTITEYNQSFVQPVGYSDQDRGDSKLAARLVPESVRTIDQDGVSFVSRVPADTDFDLRGRPLKKLRSSSLGTRTDLFEYSDNLSKWILGRIAKVTNADTGKVMVYNAYNATTGNLDSVSKFGLIVQNITYNTDGTVASVADNLNPATVFSNYKRGIPRSIRHPDATTQSGEVNDYGAVISRTDQYGYITSYGYDAIGRLHSVSYPTADSVVWNNTTVTFSQVPTQEFDLNGNHWKQVVQTGNGIETTYYDALWRPVYAERYDSADPTNTSRIVKRQYDFAGRKTFESYPQRNYQSISGGVYNEYDGLGRPTVRSTISELGTLYDGYVYSSGFQKTYTDAKGNNSYYTYQAFDEPTENTITSIGMPEGVAVSIVRDLFGKAKSITRSGAGLSLARSYVYDTNERLCKTIEPETGATVQDYDGASNVSWRATGLSLPSPTTCDTTSVPGTKKATFTYDTLNRLKDTTFGDGSAAINRIYTLDGLPNTVSSNGTTWTYGYNKRRLLQSETLVYGSGTYNIGRSYDANGALAQLTYPVDNLTVAYNPNALGEPRQVGPYASAITYWPSGAVAGFTYGNGIRRTMTQNMRGLPETAVDGVVLSERYTYDKNANVESITDNATPSTASRSMGYDGLNRLKTTSAPSLWSNATYGYDALDNLVSTSITAGPNVRSTVHNIDYATNRLASITNGPASFNFAYGYDGQGNITSRGTQTYQFDLANRMTAAPGRATYVYDGLGRRVSVVGTDGVNRIQVYSQGGQLLYVAPSGSGGTKYIYLHNHQIAEVK